MLTTLAKFIYLCIYLWVKPTGIGLLRRRPEKPIDLTIILAAYSSLGYCNSV